MERQVRRAFRVIIYEPLLVALARAVPDLGTSNALGELRNADDAPLRRALQSGRVQYADGVFSGQFSRAIVDALRAIGAKLDKRAGVYRAEPSAVPSWAKADAALYRQRAQAAHQAVKAALDQVDEWVDRLAGSLDIDPTDAMDKIETGFRERAKGIEVMPELSDEAMGRLRSEYIDSTKLSIKKWTSEATRELRGCVEENAIEGYRMDKLVGRIRDSAGVTSRKAKFLARQETALFMAKYREGRFKDAGVTRYIWSTAHDAKVRPAIGLSPAQRAHAGNHRVLDGRTFFYDQPPIVDSATGRRANPGSDWNCRCVDVPVLDPIAVGT